VMGHQLIPQFLPLGDALMTTQKQLTRWERAKIRDMCDVWFTEDNDPLYVHGRIMLVLGRLGPRAAYGHAYVDSVAAYEPIRLPGWEDT